MPAVVVARYEEALDWIHDLTGGLGLDIYVYNRGPPLCHVLKRHVPKRVNEIPCENVGREAHVYLQFIVDHYDDLPQYVVFTQAQYRDHMTDWTFRSMLAGFERPPNEPVLETPWSQTLMQYYGWTEPCNYTQGQRMHPAGMSLGDWFLEYIGTELPPKCPWWRNAIFCVTRAQILSHPKAKYEKIMKTLVEHRNPETAHYMERFWYVLFGPR